MVPTEDKAFITYTFGQNTFNTFKKHFIIRKRVVIRNMVKVRLW